DINIYQVEWEKTREIEDIHTIYLFSLRMEKSSSEEWSSESIERVLPLIKQEAAKVINVEETEINATFPSSNACLETARKAIQNYLHFAVEVNKLPHILKIGLHTVNEEDIKEGRTLELFDEPIAARDSAEPYEIVITSRFYSNLTTELKKACKGKKDSPDIKNPFYTFQLEKSKEHPPVFVSLLPDEAAKTGSTPCFYCGNTTHPTSRCPSKLIQSSTKYLEELACIPLYQIRRI
ncbi:unnamed protein product, partial [marine sediment metagenome]